VGRDPLRVLVVGHAAVVPLNQAYYALAGTRPDLDVAVMAPRRWPSGLQGDLSFRRHPLLPPHRAFPTPVLFGRPGALMHLHTYPAALGPLLRFRPRVVHVDGEPYSLAALQFGLLARATGAAMLFYTNQNILKRRSGPVGWVQRMVFALSSGGTTLNDEAIDVLRRQGYAKPLFSIPYGIDVEHFSPVPAAERAALRARVVTTHALRTWQTDDTWLGYFGRLVPEKGVDDLLDALALLARRGRYVRLLVVGGGAHEAALRRRTAALGLADRVAFVPAVSHDQVAAYYRGLDAIVVPSRTTPSWKEQLGRVLLEAMACGVPVAGSDSGEIPHVIAQTQGGVVFPEQRPDQLAACLETLLDDPALQARMAATGRQRVVERYSIQTVAHRLDDVYHTMARTSPLPRGGVVPVD
jgi:glycosyltransferase involved in cell wall biosynthesis